MKHKLKLEMKENLFIVSVLIYIISLVLLMGLSPGVFTGVWFFGVFANSQVFSVVSTLIVGIIMILFTYLARKISINFIYIVRGILLLLAILNALFIGWEPISCSIYFVATVALIIITYIKDNEYVISNNLTQEEKESIEKENKREREHEIVGSLLGFFLVPIIVVILLAGATSPIVDANMEELKNSYRVNMPSEMASEEQSDEFLANIDNYKDCSRYSEYNSWNVDTDLIGKMLKSDSNTDDYWMIGDDIDIIYHLFYDDWDNVADEHILIREDYKFPDPATAKVTSIQIGTRKLDLTEQEIEEIRNVVLLNSYDANQTIYYDRVAFEDAISVYISWYFEEETALYYNEGVFIKHTDGKYYLRTNELWDNVYVLPDEICKKLDAIW